MFKVTEAATVELRKKMTEIEQPESPLRLLYRGFG